MITADQLVLHALGDYVLQSDWMANSKTSKSIACLAHVVTYTLPFFLFLPASWPALAVIAGTHFVIDRWRLAKYICYVKNFLGPSSTWHPWAECSTTGYHKDRPPWMSVWLMIITDNLMHVVCNALALRYL